MGGYDSHDLERWKRVMRFNKGTKSTGPLNQTKRMLKKKPLCLLCVVNLIEYFGSLRIIFLQGNSGLWLTVQLRQFWGN